MKWPWNKSEPEPTRGRRYEAKSFTLGLTDSLGKFMILGAGQSASTPASALSLYELSSAVATPIDLIADTFSVIGIALQVGNEVILEHDALDFMKAPSPFFDQELFLNVLAKNYLITGEASFVAVGNINRPPLRLTPISPGIMTPVAGEASEAPSSWIVSGRELSGTYSANVNAKDVRYLDGNLRELEVIRGFSPRNNSLLRGQSPLVAASREVRSNILGTEHNVSILENGGRVSLVFHFEEDMDDDDFEAVREDIISRYGGSSKAGTIGVTAGGKLQVEELGATPKDMDFANLQSLVSKAVAMRYKVPLPLVSDERQTLNNYELALLALYDHAVIPLSQKILSGLGMLLLPRYGLDPKKARFIINQDTVTALVQRRNAELKMRRDMNLETINELRASLGREEIEGGDELYQNATLVPVGKDLFTDDNEPDRIEPVLGGASDNPDTEPGSNPSETEPQPPGTDQDQE